VRRLLDAMKGASWLMAALLYGAGLRQIVVRDGKGARDRATMLPESPLDRLEEPRALYASRRPGHLLIGLAPRSVDASHAATLQPQ
jgi:hypothetical protein